MKEDSQVLLNENRTPMQIFIDWFKYEHEHYGTPMPENILKQAENLKAIEKETIVYSFCLGKKFVIIIHLDKECFNDPEFEIYTDSNGDIIEFNSIDEAKEQAIDSMIHKFIVCEKSTSLIHNQ
jgi:hypothetical protein